MTLQQNWVLVTIPSHKGRYAHDKYDEGMRGQHGDLHETFLDEHYSYDVPAKTYQVDPSVAAAFSTNAVGRDGYAIPGYIADTVRAGKARALGLE